MNVRDIYRTVEKECEGFDAIYEDYIILLVGEDGLNKLKENRLVESCGSINGRKLYALCEMK